MCYDHVSVNWKFGKDLTRPGGNVIFSQAPQVGMPQQDALWQQDKLKMFSAEPVEAVEVDEAQ